MYCVIYKFIVHSSKAEDFIAGWKGLTQETYKNERSLGSRLHKVSEMEYLAYAQWPSKEVYENANNMSEAAHRYRNQMRESCVSIEVLNEMQVVEDLLDNNPQRKTPTSELHFVIYGAHIKSEKQKEYIEGWKGLTELIREFENGLGSRLHKVSNELYIAYAQWPSTSVFKNAGGNMPTEADNYRNLMNVGCTKFETLYEMELISDVLKTSPYKPQ